jgi:hypothetical protein
VPVVTDTTWDVLLMRGLRERGMVN